MVASLIDTEVLGYSYAVRDRIKYKIEHRVSIERLKQ